MAALHREPGCSLAPLLPAMCGLTLHPAAQILHPEPEPGISHPVSCVRARMWLQPTPLPQDLSFGDKLPAVELQTSSLRDELP